MSLRIALVGCGFMGRRHVRGLGRLRAIGYGRVELAAVCDVVPARAEAAAAEAADLLGARPDPVVGLGPAAGAAVDAVVITTPPDTHEEVATAALEAGRHVMVEKPITLTVEEGRRLRDAAARTGRVLAVAENYRRDPVGRLARALVDGGVLGRVYMGEQSAAGHADEVIISVWRHQRRSGAILVDMGVHYADVLEYLLGPTATIAGMAARVEPRRRDRDGAWHEVDAEDVCLGVAATESGALVHWMMNYAARGESVFRRVLSGTGGTLAIPRDRSGQALRLVLADGAGTSAVPPDEQLRLVPGFALDDVTARLFGGERLAGYERTFAETDANLLAVEHADFAGAVLDGRAPEVGPTDGLRALAVSYGFLDAARAGRTLRVADLVDTAVGPYQADLR